MVNVFGKRSKEAQTPSAIIIDMIIVMTAENARPHLDLSISLLPEIQEQRKINRLQIH